MTSVMMMRTAGRRRLRRLIRALVWSRASVPHYVSGSGRFEVALAL